MNEGTISNDDLASVIGYTFLAFVLMSLVLVLFFYYSRKKIVQKEIEKKDLEINYQKQQVQAVIRMQEDERQRIAKDLHDEISSSLNIISLNGHLLRTDNLSQKEQNDIVNNIINSTSKAIVNSRRIAHDLLPPVFEKFGLDAGISELCSEINATKQVSIKYENNVDFKNLTKENQLHIFRILQELINNSIRHGKAKNISITFQNNDLINCNYKDDGVGFDIKSDNVKRGLGINNINSRIEILHGTIQIHSKKDQGTFINFKF